MYFSQEIDLFGEIAGISLSPDGDALFVGIADRTYGSLMQFRRARAGVFADPDCAPPPAGDRPLRAVARHAAPAEHASGLA